MGKICANFNCSVSMLINDSKRKELPNQFGKSPPEHL